MHLLAVQDLQKKGFVSQSKHPNETVIKMGNTNNDPPVNVCSAKVLPNHVDNAHT